MRHSLSKLPTDPAERKKIFDAMVNQIVAESEAEGKETTKLDKRMAYVFFLISYDIDALTLTEFGRLFKQNTQKLTDHQVVGVAQTEQTNLFIYPIHEAEAPGFIDEQCALVKALFKANEGVMKVHSVSIASIQHLTFYEALEKTYLEGDPMFTGAVWPGDNK